MLNDLAPLLKQLPPSTASALTAAIGKCGKELGMGPDWVQRWIAFTVVADGLASYAPTGEPAFEFKGGAAIEMRLRHLQAAGAAEAAATADSAVRAQRPRATKDLDATFRGALDELEAAVRAALAAPRYRFGFRVEVETPDAPHMRRFRVRVFYRTERFGGVQETSLTSVKLEISPYEGTHRAPEMVPAFSLRPFGFEGPETLPCIPLTKQIAQKLHAVTERPEEGKTNDRFRDLLDIVLLSAFVPPSAALREVCEETFHLRRKHPWPPEIVSYPHWTEPMEARAREMGLDQAAAHEIVEHVAHYVRRVANAEPVVPVATEL